MKKIVLMTVFLSQMALAQNWRHYPDPRYFPCPHGGHTFLPVAEYGSGKCLVKVLEASGYEANGGPHIYETEKSVECQEDDVSSGMLEAIVSYQRETSRCGSILGCHYHCRDEITLVHDKTP